MADFTFQEISGAIEARAKTIIDANRENLRIEREDRIRNNTAQGERMGKIEDSVTALRDVDLAGIRTQLNSLALRSNGWRSKVRQYGPALGISPGMIALWEAAKYLLEQS